MNELTQNILLDYSFPVVGGLLTLAFALLYFGLCTSLYLIFNWTNKKGWTQKVSILDLFEGQIKFEIINSIKSIIVFGLYGVLIVYCYRNGFVSMTFENNYQIFISLLILIIWNEFHFYLCHKLMHTKHLVKFHRIHHKSVVVTPFSTYSFHLTESILLGSVMILPMFVYEFELIALVIFPIFHLFFNSLGHSNVKLIKSTLGVKKAEVSTHHNNHHTTFNSNFGFATSLIDRILKTHFKKSSTK